MEKDQERLKVIMIKIRREENKKSLYEFITLLEDIAVPESLPKDEGDNRNQLDLPDNLVLRKGRIELPNQLVISYCSQDTSKLSGTLREYAAENEIDETLFLALLRKLDFSRTQFEKRIEDYSGGQKKKVLIAGSLCQRAHLYIWDEPLNFIDVFSRMQIEDLILKFKPTMILVEHDKMFMEHVATRIITL